MKYRNLMFPFLVILIGTCWLISCGIEEEELPADQLKSAAVIPAELTPDCNYPVLSSIELSQDEEDMLLFVREEEKMARDVYDFIDVNCKMAIFDKIAAREQVHMDKVWCLLIHFNLEDPALEPGVFVNEEIQAQYNYLVELGSGPITDALMAGAILEDYIIQDINDWLLLTQNESILSVFENILCGAEAHLAEFVKKLENFGIDYEPAYLLPADYQSIIEDKHEPCGP